MTPYPNEPAYRREEHAAADRAREDGRAKLHYGPVPFAREPTERERLAAFLRDFLARLDCWPGESAEWVRVRGVVESELRSVSDAS